MKGFLGLGARLKFDPYTPARGGQGQSRKAQAGCTFGAEAFADGLLFCSSRIRLRVCQTVSRQVLSAFSSHLARYHLEMSLILFALQKP